MADRLAELRRQRALLQVHLAWLDREITRAGGDPNSGSFPPFGSTPSTAPFVAGSNPPLPASGAGTPAPGKPSPAAPAAASPQPVPLAAPAAAVSPPAAPGAGVAKAEADALLQQYRREPEVVHRDVRQGCLLYFVGALVLLAAGVAALYFVFRAK